MRVLMFGWEFPPHIAGGLGTACLGLSLALRRLGVEVSFVVPKLFGSEGEGQVRMLSAESVGVSLSREEIRLLSQGTEIFAVDSFLHPYLGMEDVEWLAGVDEEQEELRLRHWSEGFFRFSGHYGKNLMDEVWRYSLVASSLARRENFDVIHAHDWLTYLAGIEAKRISGKPLVVHVHATEFDRSGENVNQLVYDIERAGMHAADRVITVSHRTREIVIHRYGVDPSRVVAIHNAVEFGSDELRARIEAPYPEKIVTFLGRITFQKGPDYFVEVAHRVLERDRNVRFVMAGSGDMLERMIRRVAQLRMSSRFHFAGFLRGDEVDRMYRMSDVYVMPSVSEPFGITPLEAMRSQVPVIISKQSGVAEVLKYAMKVDFWDIDGMADAIYGMLHYPALSAFFRHYGQQEVTTLKWDSSAHRVRGEYERLLQR